MYLTGFVLVCFLWLAYKRSKDLFTVPPEKAFDSYARLHPDCVKDGQVRCANCGGKQIWLRLHAADQTKQINSHVCKGCGHELYRSITRL